MTAYRPVHAKTPVPASPAEVLSAIAEIQQFHQIGRESLAKYPRGKVYGRMTKEAAKVKLHPETLRKARVMADPEAGYTQSELADLCSLIKEHGFWRGRPIGPTHVIRFMTIPRRQRAAFQREAIQGRWSLKHLDAEIRLKFSKRRTGVGRRPGSLGSPEEVCYTLVRLAENPTVQEQEYAKDRGHSGEGQRDQGNVRLRGRIGGRSRLPGALRTKTTGRAGGSGSE